MHLPVLKKEVVEFLEPEQKEFIVDCTADGGGHTVELAKRVRNKVIAIEIEKELVKLLKERVKKENLEKKVLIVNGDYSDLTKILKKLGLQKKVDGFLLDLGFSSWHIEQSGKGFSFLKNEFLDMRYKKEGLSAYELVNRFSEKEIEKILRDFGQERYAKRIAKKIVQERKEKEIKTTQDLVEIIKKAVPKRYLKGKIHCATRTFQALRIFVNQELKNLKKVLPQILEAGRKKSRIVIISFHSLEDRIVKNFFKEKEKEGILKILTPKPIKPSLEEIKNNKKSRSAKLRVAEII